MSGLIVFVDRAFVGSNQGVVEAVECVHVEHHSVGPFRESKVGASNGEMAKMQDGKHW